MKYPAPPRKVPHYRTALLNEDTAKTYSAIVTQLNCEKRYRRTDYREGDLAAELGVSLRTVSQAILQCTGANYRALVNGLRLHDACLMLSKQRYDVYTAEEIGLMCGFSSRQAFYLAFSRAHDCTPRAYRLARTEKG